MHLTIQNRFGDSGTQNKGVETVSTHLFTGFPGFISSQLVKGLIEKGEVSKIYALVQPQFVNKAKVKAEEILKQTGKDLPIEIISGDITKESIGLDVGIVDQLYKETLTIWHLAAVYDLAVKAELAWLVNVEGTENVNKFVTNHPSVTRYMYFSTAYVAGMREGVLLETELIRPKAFKNHYEETKFEAEQLVEKLKNDVPVTIIRPGIVRGHSKTGETIKFDGPYFFMNMIDRLRWMPIIPFIGKSDAKINVVPIDYIIDASIFLSRSSNAASRTVHLTDPAPYTVEKVYEAMVIELTGKKPKGRMARSLAEKGLVSKRIQRMLGVEKETLDYLTWDATFDTTIAEQLLQGSGLHCADFIKTIPAMVAFYERNKKNREYHVKIG